MKKTVLLIAGLELKYFAKELEAAGFEVTRVTPAEAVDLPTDLPQPNAVIATQRYYGPAGLDLRVTDGGDKCGTVAIRQLLPKYPNASFFLIAGNVDAFPPPAKVIHIPNFLEIRQQDAVEIVLNTLDESEQ